LGEGAPLSASSLQRLKEKWQGEYAQWKSAAIEEKAWAYLWADGIYVKARIGKEKAALLVVIGVESDGQKRFLALEPGYRESKVSWALVLGIGVAIANTHGIELHYFVSTWEGFHQVDSRGLKTVEVEVPALYLFPGTYFLSVWVKKQGGAYDDAVHKALGFDVEEASITPYTTYFTRYSCNSQVYAPSRWRFIN
jgi:hypothetical protein